MLDIPLGLPAKVRKAIYGLTNAPRAWWASVCETFQKLGLIRLRTDAASWIIKDPRTGSVVGNVIGHVDDFLIMGDHGNGCFTRVRAAIAAAYRWSPWQLGEFVYAGIRIRQRMDFSITLDQQEYLDNLEAVKIAEYRVPMDKEPLTAAEVSELRGVLGAIQWPATQLSPHLSAELSMLQSSLAKPTVADLKAANKLLKYTKKDSRRQLTIFTHGFCHWQDLCLMAWTDAAVANRPDLSSTGGQVMGMARRDQFVDGKMSQITLLAWSSRKLRRVARSSLAAEVQALAEGADNLWLARLQWAEFNGFDVSKGNEDAAVRASRGLLITDAKSIYDAITRSETQGLGLQEKQSALELLGVKEQIQRDGTDLRWVHSQAQLADGLTKVGARPVIEKFLEEQLWACKYDPAFESAKKRSQARKPVFADVVGGFSNGVE